MCLRNALFSLLSRITIAEVVTEQSANDAPEYLTWIEQTRLKIDAGIEAAERNEVLDAEAVLAQLRNKVKAARAASE